MTTALKHKAKYALHALAASALLGLLGPVFVNGTVSAAAKPPGTCFMNVQGKTPYSGPCTQVAKGIKNNNGKPDTKTGTPLSPTKCYEISESLSTQSITEVTCTDTPLPGAAATQMCSVNGKDTPCVFCPNGETAPGNNVQNCNVSLSSVSGKYYCGGGNNAVRTAINIGCRHEGNAILDALFAIIRFLTTGVGLVLVGSMIWAGIQYTTSRGDPNATSQAITRIRTNVIALLLFVFAYALLNYVVPGAVLK